MSFLLVFLKKSVQTRTRTPQIMNPVQTLLKYRDLAKILCLSLEISVSPILAILFSCPLMRVLGIHFSTETLIYWNGWVFHHIDRILMRILCTYIDMLPVFLACFSPFYFNSVQIKTKIRSILITLKTSLTHRDWAFKPRPNFSVSVLTFLSVQTQLLLPCPTLISILCF